MQNNFNDTINHLKDFSLTPSNDVWKEIESNLDEKKKRRIVAWWWSLPIFGLITISVLFINNHNSIKSKNSFLLEKTSLVVDKSSQTLDESSPILGNKGLTLDENSITLDKTSPMLDKNSPILDKKSTISLKMSPTFYEKSTLSAKNKSAFAKNIDQYLEKGDGNYLKSNEIRGFNQSIAISKNNTEKDNIDLAAILNKSPFLNHIKKDTLQQKTIFDSVRSIATKNVILNKKQTKKLDLSIAFGGGVNYVSHNSVFGKDGNANSGLSNLATQPATSSSSGQFSNNNLLPLPKTGYNFSVGINANYILSKKWSLQSGLAYKYLQNNLSINTNATNAFSAGGNFNYKNHFHLLQIPLNISYCLNTKAKNKVSLIGGATANFSLENNWLFADNQQGYYAAEKNNINNILFELQAGASISFNNKFSVSLLAQKSITPVQKSSSKYYWQQLNFQVNIPLKK